MKLEFNHELVAEAATVETIQALLRDVPPDHEVLLTLWASDSEYLQASGVTTYGFHFAYVNQTTGQELVSAHGKLKRVTVMKVFDHFVRHDGAWKSDIAWRPAYPRTAAERFVGFRRALSLRLSAAFTRRKD